MHKVRQCPLGQLSRSKLLSADFLQTCVCADFKLMCVHSF
jgi:hypothetical protein